MIEGSIKPKIVKYVNPAIPGKTTHKAIISSVFSVKKFSVLIIQIHFLSVCYPPVCSGVCISSVCIVSGVSDIKIGCGGGSYT